MRRFRVEAWGSQVLALALAACGSGSSPDLCTRAVAASQGVANQLNFCIYGDAGVSSAVTSLEIANCKTALTPCMTSDQKTLDAQVTCIANLTAVSCKWYAEAAMGEVDGGLSQWIDEVAACQPSPALSASCPGLGGLAPTPCGENVCAPPLICQNTTPSCGPSCGCKSDSDCRADQRCGPTGCGMACFHPPTF